jgi:hypothetical protein
MTYVPKWEQQEKKKKRERERERDRITFGIIMRFHPQEG